MGSLERLIACPFFHGWRCIVDIPSQFYKGWGFTLILFFQFSFTYTNYESVRRLSYLVAWLLSGGLKKTFNEAPGLHKEGCHLQLQRYASLWMTLLVSYVNYCMFVSGGVVIFRCICKIYTSYQLCQTCPANFYWRFSPYYD